MKVAYFDCFSGISGDMCLGALLDAGAHKDALLSGLKTIPLKGYEISVKNVSRAGIKATAVTVEVKGKAAPARRFSDVKTLIAKSRLPEHIRDEGIAIFEGLFRAEARVHGGRYDRVHLHELGAVDAVVDVMGTLILLDDLKVERVQASAVNVGSGTVRTTHGELPVPAPATVELLRSVPMYGSDSGFELTTPTGAAILREVASGYGPMPLMENVRTGYGAGSKNVRSRPNVLRVMVGSAAGGAGPRLCTAETNIDDMNPQLYAHVMERLFKAGALDVWLTQVIMKKGRPAVKLSVLCEERHREAVVDAILAETTTLGVRHWAVERTALKRAVRTVQTEFGPVRYKEAGSKAAPEFEDVRRAAGVHGIPLVELLKRLSEPPEGQ